MESLIAISITGNIIQFIECALVAMRRTSNGSHDGLRLNPALNTVHNDVQASLRTLRDPDRINHDGYGPDEALSDIICSYTDIYRETFAVINALKFDEPGSGVIHGITRVVKNTSQGNELKEVCDRLCKLREQALAYLISLVRDQAQKLEMTLGGLILPSEIVKETSNLKLDKVLGYLISKETTEVAPTSNTRHPRDFGARSSRRDKVRKTLSNASLPKQEGCLDWDSTRELLQGYQARIHVLMERKRKELLQTLYYCEIKEREPIDVEVYRSTLEKAFARTNPKSLIDWLQEGNGIYWVSGKTGSGKSTMMRFLANHQKTMHCLKQWASKKRLIVAEHIFWNQGTPLQKSQEGFLQSLLFQILSQEPDLIPIACGERWNTPYEDIFRPWEFTQLLAALENIATTNSVWFRVCLFIDGLDEYCGDHAQLTSLVRKMGNWETVKLCASSRKPYHLSGELIENQWGLELRDLTHEDLCQIVKDNLAKDTRFAELEKSQQCDAEDLIAEITERADGVFLWAFLVVRSLVRGLRDEDGIADLHERLRELPRDLSGLFTRMLNNLDAGCKMKHARLLLTMAYAETTLPLLTLCFINFSDEGHAAESDLPPLLRDWPNLNNTEVEALTQNQMYLIARKEDLLHIATDPDAPVLLAERVGFIHRMVLDFIQTRDTEEMLLQMAGSEFNPQKTLFKTYLSQTMSFLHLHRLVYMTPYLKEWILGTFYYAYALEVSTGIAEVSALDELEAAIMREFEKWDHSQAMSCLFGAANISSFLELACRCDLLGYVTEKHPKCDSKKLDVLAPEWRRPFDPRHIRDSNICEKQGIEGIDSDWRLGRALQVINFSSETHLATVRRLEGQVSNPRPLKKVSTANTERLSVHHSFTKLINQLRGQPDSYYKKSRYRLGTILHTGAYCIVREANNAPGQKFAVKTILKHLLKGDKEAVGTRLDMLQRLEHPRLLRFTDWFESKDHYYIVTEFAYGGSLLDRLKCGRLPDQQAAWIIKRLIRAVDYLHGKNIVHGNLKPDKLLYLRQDDHSSLVLSGLDVLRVINGDGKLMVEIANSESSGGFRAPEVLVNGVYGKASDMWSIGVMAFVILTNYLPFGSENLYELFRVATSSKEQIEIFDEEIWGDIGKDARDFVLNSLRVNPKDRWTSSKALTHAWIN